jgi:outer membrane protein assembly factor BamB
MKIRNVILLAAFCLLAACSPAAAPAASPTAAIPPTNTPAPDPGTVKWTFQTGGAIWGSPTVQDKTVYAGSDDGNLYALSASSGEVAWKFAAGGIVRSTPALADGRIFITSDNGFAYAVDAATGAQAWATDIGNVTAVRDVSGKTDPSFDYLQSSPVIADDRLYVGSADGNVYALAADTGEVVWKFATGAQVRATPTVAEGVVYIGSWSGVFHALDAETGEPRWSFEASTQLKPEYLYRPIQTRALVAEGLVVCASRKASVFALDIKTGEQKWEKSYGNAQWVESSPVLEDGILYIGSSGSKYVLTLDLATGKPAGLVITQTFNWGTPALSGGMVYVGGTVYQDPKAQAGLIALRANKGAITNPEWNLPIPTTMETSGEWFGVASSPQVVDRIVYFAALDGKVYAVQG